MKKLALLFFSLFIHITTYSQSIKGMSLNPFQGKNNLLIFTGGGINNSIKTNTYYVSHGNSFLLNRGICGISIPTLVLVNGYDLSTPLAGISYEWYVNEKIIPGATSQTYKAAESGRYSVKVNISTGCSSAISDNIFVSILSSILEENLISIGPNPVNEFVTIRFSAEFGDLVTVSVFDLVGKNVLTKNGVVNSEQLDFRSVPAGNYLVKIKGTSLEKMVKLLKY